MKKKIAQPWVAFDSDAESLAPEGVFLQFKCGDKPRSAMMIELLPDRIDTLRGHFDDLRYGRIPKDSLIGLGSVTNIDPTRAPAGKAKLLSEAAALYEQSGALGGKLRTGELAAWRIAAGSVESVPLS